MKYYIHVIPFLLLSLQSFCQTEILISNSVKNDTSSIFTVQNKVNAVHKKELSGDNNISVRNQTFPGYSEQTR